MAAMLQIPRVFPHVSCLGSAKAVQCPRPRPKIGDKVGKSRAIPLYVPGVNPPGWLLISALSVSKCQEQSWSSHTSCRACLETPAFQISRPSVETFQSYEGLFEVA